MSDYSPTGDPANDHLYWRIKRAGRIIMYHIGHHTWWTRRAIFSVCHAKGEFKTMDYNGATLSLAVDDLVRRGLLEEEPLLGHGRVKRAGEYEFGKPPHYCEDCTMDENCCHAP